MLCMEGKGGGDEGRTHETAQVLCSIGRKRILAGDGWVEFLGLPVLAGIVVLLALETVEMVSDAFYNDPVLNIDCNLPVKKNTTNAKAEILAKTSNSLLKKIPLRSARRTLLALILKILLQDLIDRNPRRNRDQLAMLANVLPVVNEDRLDVIWKINADLWASVVVGLL